MSGLVWGVLRGRRHLGWWLERYDAPATPRLLLAAQAFFAGMTVPKIAMAFVSGRYGPPPLDAAETAALEKLAGHSFEHPGMPDAVRYEVPDWILPRLAAAFGTSLSAEMAALSEPAPLDLRVNLLKSNREQAVAALAREQLAAVPTLYSPWGLRLAGRQSVTQGAAFRDGLIEIQGRGQPADRAPRRCPAGDAGAGLLRRRRRQDPRHRHDHG